MEMVRYSDGTLSARSGSWRGRLIAASLVAGAAGLVAAVAWMKIEHPQPQRQEPLPTNVEVVRVEVVPRLADTFEITGVVEPNRIVKVAAEVAARIEGWAQRSQEVTWRGQMLPRGVALDEGQPIAAGEPILYLNKDLLQARHERARSQYEYDEREYNRILALFEGGSTSRTELDNVRTRRDMSRAALDESTRQLERATIVAPISGILNRLPMEAGEYANSGDVVAELVDIDTVRVAVDVSERDVPYLSTGDAATVLATGKEPMELAGTVRYISALADEGTRTTRVEIAVENRGHRLHSGQIVKARLTRRVLTDVILIPLASVIPLENGKMVYVVQEEVAQRRDVELGLIKGQTVQVRSGLQPGDLLIVEGHRYLSPGERVRIVLGPKAGDAPPAGAGAGAAGEASGSVAGAIPPATSPGEDGP